jgi:16S rRNA (cytosine967-C5)-methyltransferase
VERRFHAESLGSFRTGLFELQDEASQVAGFLASPAPGSRVLDFCAGGGGKTLHLAALMENRGELFARDVSEKRLGDIRQRIQRSGAGIVRVLPAAGAHELPAASMDLVLVDAPCSGAGTFRRNPAAKLFLTREACARHEAAQRTILAQAARFVRSGGRLVYCTCTLRRAENEEVIAGFLAAHAEWSTLSAAGELSRAGIRPDTAEPFLSLLPHRHGTDGFFGAVLRRA